jgi:iron complex outermembrane recepter protein
MFRLSFLCLLFSGSLLAQTRFAGTVTDRATKEPLAGVTLYFPDEKAGTATDALGHFSLLTGAGNRTVEVRFLGYKPLIRKVLISGDSLRTDFSLEPDATQLNEVVVTGLTTGSTVKESPIPILTYNRVQWLQTNSTNLTDAVSRLPGMSQITTGVGLSKPVIRGLGFNRVITVHDGVRQEDNQWGEEHALQIDEYSIDRYEIIKGAGSMLYGSDGLGGVMSLISSRPPEAGTMRGQILTNYQTNNGMVGASGMVEGQTNAGLFGRVRVSYKNAGNYRNRYDGLVYGSAFREFDVNATVGINRKWGYSQVYVSNWHNDINVITGERDQTGRFTKLVSINTTTEDLVPVTNADLRSRAILPANYQSLNNAKVSWNTFVKVGRGNLSAIISYSQNRRQEFASPLTPGQPALYFYLQNVFYDLKYFVSGGKGLEFTIGANGQRQVNQNRGLQTLYPGYQLVDNGVFAFAQKKTDRWQLSGGLRVDVRNLEINKLYVDREGNFTEQNTPGGATRFAGLNKTYANPTGSFGASYKANSRVTIKANLARAFRAPTTPELSANGEHAGTFRYEIGSPNLKSETAWQGDIGAVWETPDISLTASLFQNRINNYTYSEKILNRAGQDSIVDPARPIKTFRYAQGNAVLSGAEVQLTVNPRSARWFNFTGTYSLVRSRNRSASNDSARYLPFLPPPRLIGQVKLTKTNIGQRLQNAYALVEVEHNAQQNQAFLAYDTETITPAYTLVSLGAGTDVVNNEGQAIFSLYLTAQNLFDVAFQSHQNRLKYFGINEATGRAGVFNMGRNVSLKVVVPLRFGGK